MRCSRALDEGEVVAEYAGEILREYRVLRLGLCLRRGGLGARHAVWGSGRAVRQFEHARIPASGKEEAGRRRVEYDIVGLNYMLTVREFFPLVRADGCVSALRKL